MYNMEDEKQHLGCNRFRNIFNNDKNILLTSNDKRTSFNINLKNVNERIPSWARELIITEPYQYNWTDYPYSGGGEPSEPRITLCLHRPRSMLIKSDPCCKRSSFRLRNPGFHNWILLNGAQSVLFNLHFCSWACRRGCRKSWWIKCRGEAAVFPWRCKRPGSHTSSHALK